LSKDGKEVKSNRQLLGHVAILNVLALWGYTVIWFYKNWKQLHVFARDHYEKNPEKYANLKGGAATWKYFSKMKPWMQTFGLLVPYYQVYIAFLFFYHVADIAPKNKMVPLHLAIIFTSIMCIGFTLQTRSDFTFLLAGVAAIPIVIVQDYLNDFWQTVEPQEAVIRKRFTLEEWLFIVLGSTALVFYGATLVISPQKMLGF
jgi:hypothetical protein